MGKFSLEITFDGSLHGPGYRANIARALDEARTAVRTSAKMQDDLRVPIANVSDPQKIGSWRIQL